MLSVDTYTGWTRFLVRAPASRAGIPGSRPARCDGVDPGGLYWCRDPDGSEV